MMILVGFLWIGIRLCLSPSISKNYPSGRRSLTSVWCGVSPLPYGVGITSLLMVTCRIVQRVVIIRASSVVVFMFLSLRSFIGIVTIGIPRVI
jgi:hypothetical protein